MSLNTSNFFQYKNQFESQDHWLFRCTFMNVNKNLFPEDRLVTWAHIFMNVEFMKCRYPKPIMDLIENLSKDFVNTMREKLYGWVQRSHITDSNTAEAKDNGNIQGTSSNLNYNQQPNKKMRYITPYESNYIIPGFMLKVVGNSLNANVILEQSCIFSRIAKPEIQYEHYVTPRHVRAKLYLQEKLIAVGLGSSEKNARKNASIIAYNILKEMCFTIKEKDIDPQSQISLLDFMNDSTIDTFYDSSNYNNLSNYNRGNLILKNMGWKEGDGLGKNKQGIKTPIQIIKHRKGVGLGVTECEPEKIKPRKNFHVEAKKQIMKFFANRSKTKLSFTTEISKDERSIIHTICTRMGLKAKSYGINADRYIVISKKQYPREIFDELSHCSNFENDSYILELPQHDINIFQSSNVME